jgi:hypothetical protein
MYFLFFEEMWLPGCPVLILILIILLTEVVVLLDEASCMHCWIGDPICNNVMAKLNNSIIYLLTSNTKS